MGVEGVGVGERWWIKEERMEEEWRRSEWREEEDVGVKEEDLHVYGNFELHCSNDYDYDYDYYHDEELLMKRVQNQQFLHSFHEEVHFQALNHGGWSLVRVNTPILLTTTYHHWPSSLTIIDHHHWPSSLTIIDHHHWPSSLTIIIPE